MFSADAHCPSCGRTPNVRFSEEEVRRARRERQAAHVLNVQCTRCGTRYWIQARDIANGKLQDQEKWAPKEPAKKKRARKGLDAADEPAIA